MANELDDEFFDRADQVIRLANQQMQNVDRSKVSASCMYATARFNAWVAALGCDSQETMRQSSEEAIDYFVKQYRAMLIENLNDYTKNFEAYLRNKVE